MMYFLFYILQLFVSFQVIDTSFIKFKGFQIIPLNDIRGYEIPHNISSIFSMYRGFPIVQIVNLNSAVHKSSVVVIVDLDKTQFNILFTLCAFFYFIGLKNVLYILCALFTGLYLFNNVFRMLPLPEHFGKKERSAS